VKATVGACVISALRPPNLRRSAAQVGSDRSGRSALAPTDESDGAEVLAGIGRTAEDRLRCGGPAFPRMSPAAIAAELHADDALGSVMAAQHLRRVNLIERQRDQSESEAVSSARARQRPMPAYSSLSPLTPGPRPSAGDRDRGPSEVIVKACPEPCPELSISDPR
jgi:hypothetical protein